MIQPTNINQIKNFNNNNINTVVNKENKKQSLNSRKILNKYEKDLSMLSPIYDKNILKSMEKSGIEKTNLNTNISNTMKKQGIDLSKDYLDTIINHLQKEHVFELYNKGYDIETLTIDIISKEITSNPVISKDNDSSYLGSIEKVLEESKTPLTKKNIETLSSYKDKVEDVKDADDSAIANLIADGDDLTINNLYKSKYKGKNKDFGQKPTQEELIALLNANGIKATSETIRAARGLIGGNIEINKANVKVFLSYRSSIDKIDIDEMISSAIVDMKKAKPLGDEVLADMERPKLDYRELNKVIEDIQIIDTKVIKNIYSKGISVNIENLQKSLHDEDSIVDSSTEEVSEDIQITKRQVEEIRLKLTLDAALKLNNKLDIKTANLEKVVEELRTLEKESNKEILENLDIPQTEDTLSKMSDIKEKLYIINNHKDALGIKVSSKDLDFTINDMAEYASQIDLEGTYFEIGTRPELRFGEGISKVEDQIEHILELNNIEITDNNIKSAKALIQNNIEVNNDNINSVKDVVFKIDTVVDELKPVIVAKLLQEGIEIDNIHVDNLIEHIRSQQTDNSLQDNAKRLAEAILELDNSNMLNPKEREALIGVYRMINTISKNETAAIGFLVANERELTLGNLFEASKYVKQIGNRDGKLDLIVDDELGFLDSDLPRNIRKIISEGTQINSQKEILNKWLNNIETYEIKDYMDRDRLLKEIEVKRNTLPSSKLKELELQVNSLEDISKSSLEFLQDKKIPLTIKNIYWFDKINKDPFLLGNLLNKYEMKTGKNLIDSLLDEDIVSADDLIKSIKDELEDDIENIIENNNSQEIYSLNKDIRQMLDVQKDISNNDTIYQIPVMLNEGISNINIYVMKDKKGNVNNNNLNETRAYMSLKTQNIGVIKVHMHMINDSIAFEMIGESQKVTEFLKSDANILKGKIEDIGLKILDSKFSFDIQEEEKTNDKLIPKFIESKFEYTI